MPTITQKFEFDAGHRVLGHEGKCAKVHGHRYVVELTVRAKDLDGLGRVVDFGVLKAIVGKWIDDHLDHNTILHSDDPLWKLYEMDDPTNDGIEVRTLGDLVFPNQTLIRFKGINPTAENIAKVIHQQAQSLLDVALVDSGYMLQVIRTIVHETPKCSAEYPDISDDPLADVLNSLG